MPFKFCSLRKGAFGSYIKRDRPRRVQWKEHSTEDPGLVPAKGPPHRNEIFAAPCILISTPRSTTTSSRLKWGYSCSLPTFLLLHGIVIGLNSNKANKTNPINSCNKFQGWEEALLMKYQDFQGLTYRLQTHGYISNKQHTWIGKQTHNTEGKTSLLVWNRRKSRCSAPLMELL